MDFDLPDADSIEMVDLLCRLDRARYENARQWIVVAVHEESREVVNAHGPFKQAEQALVEAGEQAAWWKEHAPEDDDCIYVIVPLWGPGE